MEALQQKLSPEKRKEIEDRIKFLDMRQYAIKIMINSIYGAFGNKFFYFHNKDIAQSITIQGQHLIKFSFNVVNGYFRNIWPTDKELHKFLGIDGRKINAVSTDVDLAIYSDTDSAYFNFGEVLQSVEGIETEWDDTQKTMFCVGIIKNRLGYYLESAFDMYAKAFGTGSQMKFALENVSKDGIFVAKKNYCIRITFEDGQLTKKPKLKTRGIDHAKPTWPGWAREKIENMMLKLLDCGKGMIHERDIIPVLKEYRKLFDLAEIDDVCFNKNVNKYDEYVVDIKTLELTKGIPMGARAFAYYNHLIESTGNMKYPRIRKGDKVKMYYAKHPSNPEMNVFAFHMYNYPVEFAIPIDAEEQFFRLLIKPINKLLTAMRMHEIGANLKRQISVIMPKVRRDIKDEEIYPLWALNEKTYEYVEIPHKLNKYILDDSKEITDTIVDEYIKYVCAYGIDTVIVCNMERDKHIDRLKKKYLTVMFKERILEQLPPIEKLNFEEAMPKLKELKYKMDIDEETFEPVFSRSKSDKTYKLIYQNILQIKTVDQYILILNKIFEQELIDEAEVLRKKEEKAAIKKAKEAKTVATELIPVMPMASPDPAVTIGSVSDLPVMVQDVDRTI